MRAIIGLGNPGRKYEKTRHNIGFRVVDLLSSDLNVPFKSGKGEFHISEADIEGQRTLLVKPQVFMNRSGQAVNQLIKYFPLAVENILIVYDDFNIPFGMLRFRRNGSHGGHNGIKSIIDSLKTQEFNRFRIGIGAQFDDSVNFVLSKFTRSEQKQLSQILPVCTDGVRFWIREGIEATMNKFNGEYS